MISTSANIYLPQIKEIWKTVFKDSDDYIRMFFKYQYRHRDTLLYTEEDRVKSMLFFPRYAIKNGKKIYKAGYICGAATVPESRGKGFMGRLLKRALSEMRARGDKFAVLIPATKGLAGFYAKYGFYFLFQRGVAEYEKKMLPGKKETVSLSPFNDASEIIPVYKDIVRDRSGVVLQSLRTYDIAIKIHRLRGETFIIRDKGRQKEGYLFCKENRKTGVLKVKEIMARRDVMDSVAQALFRIYGVRRIVFEGMAGGVLPFTKIRETGMIKPLGSRDADFGKDHPYMNMMLD